MIGSRIAPIPLAHVQAELAAFPLASETGLTLGLTVLRPDLKEETGELWREAERALATASPSISLDELVAIRDDLWFSGLALASELPLADYLERLANRFLQTRGSIAAPEVADKTNHDHSGDCVARNDWRWLSLALPPDLLLAALRTEGSMPTRVETVSPVLRQRWKDAGFAEPHLHLGAGLDFGRIWVNTVRGLANSKAAAKAFKSPGAGFQEGTDLASWLLRAAITRYVLAGFLRGSRARDGFLKYLGDVQDRLAEEQEVSGAAYLQAALDDLYRGQSPSKEDFAALRSLYRFLIDVRIGGRPKEPDDLWSWDPIQPLLGGGSPGGPSPEMHFVAAGLLYLKGNPRDSAFAGLFWQVIRVRCLFYRHLVQRPLTPGLQWFVRFFRRMKPTRLGLGPVLLSKTAARLSGEELGLQSLEIRVAPDADYSKFHREVKKLCLARRPKPLEIGVVIHLTRDRGGEWFEGKPTAHWASSEADPRIWEKARNTTGYRYGRFYGERKKEALAAGRLLREHPQSLKVIRGLDLCTDEAGVPTWVMAPLLRYIRGAGRQASAALNEERDVSLRTTPHAGEDFVHLMSGLRRLDEALDYLGLKEGDRLGHALSLGVEPRTWAQRAGRIPMPEEERLFDLVWEWSWYSHQGQGVPGGRSALIQREIAERSERIFGDTQAPWALHRLILDLHEEEVLRLVGFPASRPPQELKPRFELVHRYLTSPGLFEQGRRIVWVDPALDVEALEHLQAGLRRKVGRMGLTIEVNPSSNLLIGHLGELGEHPLWRLAPVSDSDGVPPLSVCIGSDDPLTFATTLPEEYQLLYDAMIQNGCSEAEAQDWLERARKAGMSARFTLPESKRPLREEDFQYAVSGLPAIDLPP